jgi:hypothetical protein
MAIYMSGNMIGVNDASGRTSYDPGQQIPKFCWTMVHYSGLVSSDYSVDVDTGEWYGAMISIAHLDDNVMYDNDLWFGSGDYYAATVVQLGRIGDVDRISNPTVATSNGVRTITFAATGLTAGSWLKCWLMRFR